MGFDIAGNRRERKWTNLELAGRLLWTLTMPAFRFSPRPFWGWRRWLLRLFGAAIGRDVHVHPTVSIAIPWNLALGDAAAVGDGVRIYNLGRIDVGARATVSQGAHLCAGTHDYSSKSFPLMKRPIRIGADVWICADAFVGPGVRIGDLAIVAARAVVMADVAPSTIVRGNPAVFVRERSAPQ